MPFTCRFNEPVISPKGKGEALSRAFQLSSRYTQLQRGDAVDNGCLALPSSGWHCSQNTAPWEQLAVLGSQDGDWEGTPEFMCVTQI